MLTPITTLQQAVEEASRMAPGLPAFSRSVPLTRLVKVPAGAGIGVIVNTQSRSYLSDPIRASYLARIVGDYGVVTSTESAEELERIAEDFKRRGVRVVAVAGGDGSNSAMLTAFRRVYGEESLPCLALLRGGTMNTVAKSLGMAHGGPEQRLAQLVRCVARGEALECEERVTVDIAGRLCFLAGAGAIYGFLAEYYGRGDPRPTPATAVETITTACASWVVQGPTIQRVTLPVNARIRVDGHTWPWRRYLAIAMGTVEQIGLGFRPFHRADERLDSFHLLGIHCRPGQFIRSLPRIRRGLPIKASWVHECLAREVSVETMDGSVPLVIDGDLYDFESPMSVCVGPRVRVVTDQRALARWRRLRERFDILEIARHVGGQGELGESAWLDNSGEIRPRRSLIRRIGRRHRGWNPGGLL